MKGSLSEGYLQMWKDKNYHMREQLYPSKVRIVEDMKYVGTILEKLKRTLMQWMTMLAELAHHHFKKCIIYIRTEKILVNFRLAQLFYDVYIRLWNIFSNIEVIEMLVCYSYCASKQHS